MVAGWFGCATSWRICWARSPSPSHPGLGVKLSRYALAYRGVAQWAAAIFGERTINGCSRLARLMMPTMSLPLTTGSRLMWCRSIKTDGFLE
jgi:hypothetical protein